MGYCGIKNVNVENWELVIELLKKYRHWGYGYHALAAMLNALTELTGKTTYRSRFDSDNYASQNFMKKLGAFHVAPIDLIGHVLEFRIDWKSTDL